MKTKAALFLVVVTLAGAACEQPPAAPTTGETSVPAASVVVGEMAVAFLNRFAASSVAPRACVVDFTDACRGKGEELSDIEFNRSHFEIVGARLGPATVQLAGNGASASISVPCDFDSRVMKCESADVNCRVGVIGYVAGTCLMTAVRETAGWRLCTSNFAGAEVHPSAQLFFGPRDRALALELDARGE